MFSEFRFIIQLYFLGKCSAESVLVTISQPGNLHVFLSFTHSLTKTHACTHAQTHLQRGRAQRVAASQHTVLGDEGDVALAASAGDPVGHGGGGAVARCLHRHLRVGRD